MLSAVPRLTRPLLIGIAAVIAALLVLLPASGASAHPAGSTGVFITVQSDAVDVKMQIQKAGFVAATGYDIATDQAELDAVADNLMTFILNRVTVADDSSTLTASVIERPRFVTVNDEDSIETAIRFADDGRPIEGAVTLDYDFILDVVPSHQVYVALVSDWNNGQVAEGDPEVVGVLGGGVTEITLDRAQQTPLHGFFSVVWLGMLHIAEGTDHLLFLTTLLIVAPSLAVRSRRGFRWTQPIPTKRAVLRAALIITSFTVGHLITLALVSLGVISFPTKPVEILVAVSIVVAAVHAIKPLMPRGELLIAGVFGLVHGTAFATTILDLNLGFGEKLVAILGFNIGVELAQLIAAVLVLPLLIWLSHARAYPAFRTVIAGLAIVAASAWIIAISIDGTTVLQPVFDGIARYPLVGYLVLVAVVATLWHFTRDTQRKSGVDGGAEPTNPAGAAEAAAEHTRV
ncbi:HupE/UreJ family protein [Microbacterium sp. NEAU-LLC]|uniref:HupE/UreJ family protein n=1 Tax=Microbacterium helvum TaxID=2773713 RepID=A0ABR8NS45_9MICO|nr:HupE/UreJ family protein [Microbacterium helvum]MBD3943435.1 HupE/UreJ family protein [Microbacterium helvum]